MFLRIATAVLLLLASPAKVEVSARHGKSLRGTLDGAAFLLLRGTHRERGVDHGFLAGRDVIRILDEGLLPLIEKRRAGAWEQTFLSRVDRFAWPKRYEEEAAGMLEGIRKALPKKEDRTLRTLKREIALADLKAMNCLSDIIGMGCSSFSVWGDLTQDGKPLVGRNLDYMAFPLGPFQCLIAVEPAEKDLRATIDPLFIGALGVGTPMNADGVFLALHDADGLEPGKKQEWVPRSLALRSATESGRSPEEVAELLKKAAVSVGNNVLTVAGDATAAVLEWDGSGVTVRRSKTGDSLVCTNHYVDRAKRDLGGDSGGRYETLVKGIDAARAARRKIDFEGAKAMLGSVCRNGGLVTHLSVVAWPAARRVAFAVSPAPEASATKGRWVTVEWDDIFKN